MGTTLTGTTPQDTYDSLIKVTDNGPLSGTLKALSDGLGNDSTLSLSTTAASIAGTLAVTGNATFDTNTLVVDATNNRLAMGGATVSGYRLNVYGLQRNIGTDTVLNFGELDASGTYFQSLNTAGDTAKDIAFYGTAELMRIKGTGNVGIGTSAPAALLSLSKSADASINVNTSATGTFPIKSGISFGATSTALGGDSKYSGGAGVQGINTAQADNVTDLIFWTTAGGSPSEKVRVLSGGGITFNGDTAAANALDDYEEGTWTMGVSFGGASVGVTTSSNTGTYTKIGRQVTVNGYLVLTGKGSSTGSAVVTGLPFTIANTTGNYSAPSLYFSAITFTNQFQGYGNVNTTNIALEETTILGVSSAITDADFASNSNLIVSLNYFV